MNHQRYANCGCECARRRCGHVRKRFVFHTSVNGRRRNLTCNCGRRRPDTDASFKSSVLTAAVTRALHNVTCRRDHVTAAVRTLLKVVSFAKFTIVLQPESKCLFIKEVNLRLSLGLY